MTLLRHAFFPSKTVIVEHEYDFIAAICQRTRQHQTA